MSSKLDDFLAKMINDMGAATSAALVLLGEKLGLFKALAAHGPLNAAELADRTRTTERYVREWLAAQAASHYVNLDSATGKFSMTEEQIAVFADEDNPAFLAGGFHGIASLFLDEPKITDAFRTGRGVAWDEHSECLFCGTEKFFRPGYMANLTSEWIPALQGVQQKLERGAKVADVGCGHGLIVWVTNEFRSERSPFWKVLEVD